MRKLLSLLLLTISSLAQNKKHSEINDLGYTGKIYSVTTKTYDSINNSNENIDMSSPGSIKTRFYNEAGNALKEIYERGDYSHNATYEYKESLRIGYTMYNQEGEKIVYAKITYTETGYTIDTYHNKNKFLLRKAIYTFDNNDLKTRSIEHLTYDVSGNVKNHTHSAYYYDENGFVKGYVEKNLLTNAAESYDFEILEKDDRHNPKKLRLLKDRQLLEIQTIDISYLD